MILPIGERAIISQDKVKDIYKNGLFIPDTVHVRPSCGTIIKTSINRPQQFKEGDKVLYTRTAGDNIKIDGEAYLIMASVDIQGILHPSKENRLELDKNTDDLIIDGEDTFQLLGNRIAIKIKHGSETYTGKMIIPEEHDRIISLGTVAAISTEIDKADWKLEIGKQVYADCLDGHNIKVGENTYKLIKPSELFGVSDKE